MSQLFASGGQSIGYCVINSFPGFLIVRIFIIGYTVCLCKVTISLLNAFCLEFYLDTKMPASGLFSFVSSYYNLE